MKLTWKREDDHLLCRWSEAGEDEPYNPPWMQETGNVNPRTAVPKFLDFTRLSPFGGRRWYDPNRRSERHAT